MGAEATTQDEATESTITRRSFLTGGAAALALGAYSATYARHDLEIVPVTIRIRNLHHRTL